MANKHEGAYENKKKRDRLWKYPLWDKQTTYRLEKEIQSSTKPGV